MREPLFSFDADKASGIKPDGIQRAIYTLRTVGSRTA